MANTGGRNASRKAQLKKALWVNVMSLLLCMIMLVGTTFAWFTSTVTTGVNTVQAGQMQVEMAYAYDADKAQGVLTSEDADRTAGDTDTWKEVKPDTNLFKTIGEDNTDKWQPGAAKFVQLKIRNTGDLAMKYSLGISIPEETGSVNVDGKEFKLSDYLKVAVLDGAVSFDSADAAIGMIEPDEDTNTNTGSETSSAVQMLHEAVTLSDGCVVTGRLLPTSETENKDASELQTAQTQEETEKILTFLVYMPNTATEANFADSKDAPSIKLGVTLLATQTAEESDTNSSDYDKDASYQVDTAQQLQNALLSGGKASLNSDITIESPEIRADAVLDLNGHTLTLKPKKEDAVQTTADETEQENTGSSLEVFGLTETDAYLLTKKNGSLTITGEGTIKAADDHTYSFALERGAKLMLNTVNGGTADLTGGTKTDTGTGVMTTWKCLPAGWKAEEKVISSNDDIKGTLYKMTKDKAASES